MQISKVAIRNFRMLKGVVIPVESDSVTVLVGQNNAGKSSVFRAIAAFYGEISVGVEDFCRLGETAESKIEVEIEYALGDEDTDIPEKYRLTDGRMRVIKRFSLVGGKVTSEIHGFNNSDSLVEFEDTASFFGADGVGEGKLGRVIYIPAVRKVEDEASGKSSSFNKLLASVVTDSFAELDQYRAFVASLESFTTAVRNPVKSAGSGIASVSDIERAVSDRLTDWGIKATVDIATPSPEEILSKQSRILFADEAGDQVDPTLFGSGAQRAIANALLAVLASHVPQKRGNKKVFSSGLQVILYEEPEAFLHHDQERRLLKSLEEVASRNGTQVVMSTHSPNFVSMKRAAFSSVVRLHRASCRDVTMAFCADAGFRRYLEANAESFDFLNWLNPDRSQIFFVDRVILVEGATEKTIFNWLIQKDEILENVYVVDCGLKSNIPHFMKLCSTYGIDHAVIYDKDDDHKPEHIAWNRAVEESRNPFTKACLSFDTNIEDALNMDADSRTGAKKPLLALRWLQSNTIPTNTKAMLLSLFQ